MDADNPTASTGPADCPPTPDTRDRVAAAGLSSFGTEGAALAALAAAGDLDLTGAPDCIGKHGQTPWCPDCNLSAACAARPARKRRRVRPPPAR